MNDLFILRCYAFSFCWWLKAALQMQMFGSLLGSRIWTFSGRYKAEPTNIYACEWLEARVAGSKGGVLEASQIDFKVLIPHYPT